MPSEHVLRTTVSPQAQGCHGICAGPRAAFLKAQRPELLRERNLATWLVKSDTEFAELVVGVSCCTPTSRHTGSVAHMARHVSVATSPLLRQ